MRSQLKEVSELKDMVHELLNQTRTMSFASSFSEAAGPAKEPEIVETALHKINNKLGLQVAGGKDSKIAAIYVGHIVEGGAAHIDGRIKVGDMVLSVSSEMCRSALCFGLCLSLISPLFPPVPLRLMATT